MVLKYATSRLFPLEQLKHFETLFSCYAVRIVPTLGDRRSNLYDINSDRRRTRYTTISADDAPTRAGSAASRWRNALYQRSPAEG